MPEPAADARPLLRQPACLGFLFARAGSGLAFQMISVAVGWQIYDLTGSVLAIGLVGLVQFLPMMLLTLLVGHVADRYDRRVVAAVCQAIEALATGVLVVESARGTIGSAAIYGLAAALGAARAFENPTMQALLPRLVDRALLPQATALSASSNQVAQIVGPALGGLLYAFGSAVVYGVAAAAFLASALLIASVPQRRVIAAPRPATLASLFSGIGFIARSRLILGVTSLDLFAVLFGGATSLMPVYARDVLATDVWGLGLLRAAPAVGALVCAVFLSRHALRPPVGRKLFVAIATFGAMTIVFGLSRHLALSLAALAVLGAADVVSVVIRQSLVQLETPDAMRGRVTAVNSLFIGASNQLGEFESGVVASLVGSVPAVLVGGALTLLVGVAWARLFPELLRLQDLPHRTAVKP